MTEKIEIYLLLAIKRMDRFLTSPESGPLHPQGGENLQEKVITWNLFSSPSSPPSLLLYRTFFTYLSLHFPLLLNFSLHLPDTVLFFVSFALSLLSFSPSPVLSCSPASFLSSLFVPFPNYFLFFSSRPSCPPLIFFLCSLQFVIGCICGAY